MKLLVITHQLSRTGAPIVLLDVIRYYHEKGIEIDVLTMEEGPLREELEAMGIYVQVQDRFFAIREVFREVAKMYDFVWANTLITYEAILALRGCDVPVIWWLHEGEQYFEYFKTVIPDFKTLESNIHPYAVSPYVREVVERRYHMQLPLLHIAVKAFAKVPVDLREKGFVGNPDKVKFLTVGTYSKVKAQDVLCKAIDLLPEDIMKRTEFYFIGNESMVDEEIYGPVCQAVERHSNVYNLHSMNRNEVGALMQACDCLLVPSRVDPLPTVAVEMMMVRGLVLCTEVCGIASYMKDEENGLTVPVESVLELIKKIEKVVHLKLSSPQVIADMKQKGYEVYATYFAEDVVKHKLEEILGECI
ncbi:MAG: glycosyltransferase family 4 protein [Lachnospiraceae bacterium]|nr:glycosyltransferase family 4 protein [Lachnospiraceae bacterium]